METKKVFRASLTTRFASSSSRWLREWPERGGGGGLTHLLKKAVVVERANEGIHLLVLLQRSTGRAMHPALWALVLAAPASA